MPTTNLLKLASLPEYREQRQHIFPSQSSLDWYLRKNRSALVESGALLLVTGRWFVNTERFDAYVLRAGASAATARVASTDAAMNQCGATKIGDNDDDIR